jgi:hypothetical protein
MRDGPFQRVLGSPEKIYLTFQKFQTMRNFRLIFILVIVSFSVYSCTKENQNTAISKASASNVENRTNIVYPNENYTIWQVKDQPYTLIFTPAGTNNHIWMVQRDSKFSTESIIQATNANLGLYNKSYLKLSYAGVENVYSLADNLYQNYPANAVGLVTFIDDNLLGRLRVLNESIKGGIIDDVNEKATCKKDGESDKECKCAGGANSTSCECSGSIASVSWHESVSCKTGYYACCPGL